ncbi:hypothetical protein ID866_6834 [Astraeus odoratus]|nr:hypothetical protein ID866_6834 [Astraeus odoratus]
MHRSRPSTTREQTQHDLQLDPVLQRPPVVPAQSSASPPEDLRTMHLPYYQVPPTAETFTSRDQANASNLIYGTANRGGAAPNTSSMNMNEYTHADFNYYRNMLFDLGFGENEQVVVPSSEHFRNVSYGDNLNAHYTQYHYPQTIPQNDFTN